MTAKTISLTFSTVVAALAFAAPGGAQGSMIPECLEVQALCQPAGSKPAAKPGSNDARLKTQPKASTDGSWRAGNHIMY